MKTCNKSLIGLLEAGRRYGNIDDPNFPAFAVCRIRGSILDELRRLDWRSRKTRQQAHELNDVTRDLTKSLKRTPTEQEIIRALVPISRIITPDSTRPWRRKCRASTN
ncbi:RNA polymerase sigma factor for flagellar operon [Vibrio variabilis]|uniref:RNA polymerase sigma factor for flagellar operon n=1 Tax=Vibrio variabilis TaxID=990271 RepID=A0ABQ0J8K6_9VIBR|nr:RNA polymerase sigma factor for flagellar operon [Vibrio variabilis]